MKKLVLSLTLVAFAFAVQAGDNCSAKTQTAADKPACCASKEKVATSTTVSTDKAQCPMAASTKVSSEKAQCSMAKDAKSDCCPMAKAGACKDGVAKQKFQSPKGTEQASR
jgi:hypothetical protein